MTRPAVAAPAAAANSQNEVGRLAAICDHRTRFGTVGAVSLGAMPRSAGVAGSPVRWRIQIRMSSAAAPGTIRTARAGHKVPARPATAATSSGPATAPAWSSALWTAKPRPSPTPPGGVREKCGLGGATDRLAGPFGQDEDAGHCQAGAGQERRDGQGGDADRGQARSRRGSGSSSGRCGRPRCRTPAAAPAPSLRPTPVISPTSTADAPSDASRGPVIDRAPS